MPALFSYTYLAQLQADASYDEAAAPLAQGLRDWLPFRDASTLRSLIDSWVGPVLDFLDFHHAPANDAPYIHLLYAHRADETPVGLCYVAPPGQDGSTGSPCSLDDTLKGRHPLAQAVLALRARRLRWGMLTDGTRWRLVDAESLYRYEHYLEVNVDELARSADPAALRLFYACFHRRAFTPSPSQGERLGVRTSPLPALGEGPGVRALFSPSQEERLEVETSPLPALGEGPGVRALPSPSQACPEQGRRGEGRVRVGAPSPAQGEGRGESGSPSPAQGEGRGESGFPSPSQGEGRVRVGLDQLLAASEQATQAAEDHLKARVSHNEGILAQLCLGLVRADGRARYTEAERDAIYQDATTLLYRILFILYAEARGLLPTDNPAYRAVSLSELVKTARAYKLRGMPDPQATTLWERLKRLCTAIYESDPTLGIPAYNGGLFDDADKPYLQRGSVADMHLTEALFDLACRPDSAAPDGHQPIDYRDLSVRHLGSLYEGMIEYKLQIVEETLWARRDGKGNVRFLRTGEEGAPRKTDAEIQPGQVYFSQSPGERRATGTYYTPEYIVDYIVRQTVVRGLEERRASLEEISEVSETLEVLDEELLRFVEEQVLTFRACDPAMGSGHFLVNAAHQMANFIVETLHLTPWVNEAIDTNPLTWRRRVVERCLYGVDLSRMAVELAKLSLWLASVAQDRPLSFLDHHLRQGNSLVGARLADLAAVLAGPAPAPSKREERQRAAGQLSMLDDPAFARHVETATDLLGRMAARVARTVEDIKAQEADYENVRAELEPYRQLADLWTAQHFGIDTDENKLRIIATYLANGAIGGAAAYEQILALADTIARTGHFFHWDLEFPLMRVNPQGLFDAIIGNPPYGRYGMVTSQQRDFIRARKYSYGSGDVAEAFIDQALYLLRPEGYHGFIVPKPLTYVVSWSGIRHKIRNDVELVRVADVSKAFEDVLYEQVVIISGKQRAGSEVVIVDLFEDKKLSRTVDVSRHLFTDDFFPVCLTQLEVDIGAKIAAFCLPAGMLYDCWYGKGGAVPKLRMGGDIEVLQGRQIGRYTIDTQRFPRVFLEQADATPDEDESRLRRKIVVQDIVAHITTPYPHIRIAAALDTEQYLCLNTLTCFSAKTNYDLLTLLAILNSRLASWYVHKFLFNSAIRTMHFMPGYADRVPIPRFNFDTPVWERKQLSGEISRAYEASVSDRDPSSFTHFAFDLLDDRFPHFDAVHDLLAYLAQQMIDLHKARQRLEREADLFRFVPPDTPCLPLDRVLGGPLGTGEVVSDLSAVRHDIEGLRLSQEVGADPGGRPGRWLLEVRAKLRDPDSGWHDHQRDRDGNFIRRWLPVAHPPLDEAMGRFYHYAFAHLDGFTGAGSFPGGSTRTTLEKLKATMVPRFVPVDLAPLAALEAELAEVQRKIRLTDDLIDQIVYKLYGLTEEEIAIVEGRT